MLIAASYLLTKDYTQLETLVHPLRRFNQSQDALARYRSYSCQSNSLLMDTTQIGRRHRFQSSHIGLPKLQVSASNDVWSLAAYLNLLRFALAVH